jgi:ABC-type multidrug transport system fused ATPase/permease subunit
MPKPTTVSLTDGFTAWAKSVAIPSVQSVMVGTIGAGIMLGALDVAHQAFNTQEQPQWISDIFGTQTNNVTVVLAMVILLVLVASIVQSGISQVDSMIVRAYIQRVMHERAEHEPALAGRVVAERFLLESWTGFLGSTVQLLVFSAALIFFGGWGLVLGLLVAFVILFGTAWLFRLRALKVSHEFFEAQQEANKLEGRAKRNPDNARFKQERVLALDRVREAIYRRDTTVLRMPFLQNVAISALALGAILLPAVTTLNSGTLTTVLLVTFLWRQNALEFVSTLGRTVWTFLAASTASKRGAAGDVNMVE